MPPPTEDSYFIQAFFDAMDAYIRQHRPQHRHQKIAERYQREFSMKSKVDLKQFATIWTAEKLAQREICRQDEHEFIRMLRNCGFGLDNASGMVFGSDEMWAIVAKVRPSACALCEDTGNYLLAREDEGPHEMAYDKVRGIPGHGHSSHEARRSADYEGHRGGQGRERTDAALPGAGRRPPGGCGTLQSLPRTGAAQ